jgi:signal transduction histidine kinase
MKLIQKFTLWYLVITFVVLIIGGLLSYYSIKSEVDHEQVKYLRKNIDFTIRELNKGIIPDSLSQNRMEISELAMSTPKTKLLVTDTLVYTRYLRRKEPQLKVSTSQLINGRHFYISTYGAIVDTRDITNAVVKSISTIFLIMLVVTGLVSILISRKVLLPFNRTLKAMQEFRLQQKKPLRLMETKTAEFKKLNNFLSLMTNKALKDYQTLKEFTENASHEMQTPLAIIMGKLELLLESDIDDEQAKLIVSAHDAVEKLSKVGQSLTLITKLDNREFESHEIIDFSQILNDSLYAFQELIEMKSLKLEKDIADNVKVRIHPLLINILLNNLIGNAIRHNIKDGIIHVKLTPALLEISNSGDPLTFPSDKMFNRFIKNNQSNESVGLGLAIVKQICEQSNIDIRYDYEDKMHILRLYF